MPRVRPQTGQEMCVVSALVISLSFLCFIPCYSDDRGVKLFVDKFVEGEQRLFTDYGICKSENRSSFSVCDTDETEPVQDLVELKRSSCYCDDRCSLYHDCCINKVSAGDFKSRNWSCREIRGLNVAWIPVYLYQQCPSIWKDEFVRDMCETESTTRQEMGLPFDHLQDMPVQGESTRILYRNIYCALCNKDIPVVKWETFLYCNGDSENPRNSLMDSPDFSAAYYDPRAMNFRKVKVGDRLKNCAIIVKNFDLKKLLSEYGARLCKPVISSCPDETDWQTKDKCGAYSAYVYQKVRSGNRRKVFKNFHCALCHGAPVESLICLDSFSPPLYGPPWEKARDASLTMLFDFNFEGGWEEVGRLSPCLLQEGQIWDPILGRCQNFTCGALYKKEGFKCVPLDIEDQNGLKDSCPKIILDDSNFHLMPDGSIYINKTMNHLTKEDFEVHKKEGDRVLQIAVCADETHILPYSIVHSWVSVIVLTISIICLILHLLVYGLLEKLRNCPGKILMSLAASLLCGHLFLLLGPRFREIYWLCYMNGVLIHFGYLTAFSWMCVMAFDIHGTFTVTQTRQPKKSSTFRKYSLYAWISPLCLVILSIIIDNSLQTDSDFRPRYAQPICWLNSKKGLLIFFVVPAAALLFANIVLFLITAFHIRKVSRQTKMVNNFSDKVRYFLYLKLSVVLGLAWTLGLIAGLTRMDAFWYPFIILNGLQGALIFIAFTIKRNILHMLAVKLKIRSEKYSMGKRTGIKAAMYSSLSNLTTLQTSLSSQIPTLSNQQEMLKAVRRINPDTVIDDKRK